jgi:hypothetical protein
LPVGRRSSWAFGAFHKARLGMFENIFLGGCPRKKPPTLGGDSCLE